MFNRQTWRDRADEALHLAGMFDRQRADLLVEIARLYGGLASLEPSEQTNDGEGPTSGDGHGLHATRDRRDVLRDRRLRLGVVGTQCMGVDRVHGRSSHGVARLVRR